MREASPAFAAMVTRSHQIDVRCDVLFNREVIAEGLAVSVSLIGYDRAASRIARADVSIADPIRIPVSSTDILTPYGYELRLWRGVVYPPDAAGLLLDESGTPLVDEFDSILFESASDSSVSELVALGTFPIQRSQVDAIGRLSSITCEGRSRLVSDARLEDVYQVASGTNYATAIEDLISDGVSGLEYLFPSTTHTTPLLTFDAQADRWEVAQQMARSIGQWLLFDGLGRVVMRPEPSFTDVPVLTIADGVNLTQAAMSLDRTNAYNKVISAGRNADNDSEFTGTATDDDPASPTYYDGPFGHKPLFHYSEFYSSSAQAAAGAESILAGQLGVARSLDFGLVPDPRLEVGDVVRITNTAFDLDELHIIDSLSFGLGAADQMFGTTRTRQELTT